MFIWEKADTLNKTLKSRINHGWTRINTDGENGRADGVPPAARLISDPVVEDLAGCLSAPGSCEAARRVGATVGNGACGINSRWESNGWKTYRKLLNFELGTLNC